MLLPNFRSLPKTHLFESVLPSVSDTRSTLQSMCKFYIEILKGNSGSRIPKTSIYPMLLAMEKKIRSLAEKEINKVLINKEILNIEVCSAYKNDGWFLVVRIDIISMSVMYADFLIQLKDEKPEVFEFVSDVLRLLIRYNFSPVSTVDNLYDVYEDYGLYEEAKDNEAEEWVADMEKVKDTFNNHLSNKYLTKTALKNLGQSVKERYSKMKRKFTPDQRAWVKQILEIVDLSQKINKTHSKGHMPFVEHNDYENIFEEMSDEMCDISAFFMILWAQTDAMSDYFFDDMHMRAQESREPSVSFYLNSPEGLEGIKKFVRLINLTQTALYTGDQLWTK